MDKLNQLIDSLVAEKSLSFEVVEQLKAVRDANVSLQSENEQLKKDLDLKEQARSKFYSELQVFHTREGELVARENAVAKIEHEKEISKLKVENSERIVQEIKEVVGMVFKNTNIRKRVTGTVPVNTHNDYAQSGFQDTTEEHSEE